MLRLGSRFVLDAAIILLTMYFVYCLIAAPLVFLHAVDRFDRSESQLYELRQDRPLHPSLCTHLFHAHQSWL